MSKKEKKFENQFTTNLFLAYINSDNEVIIKKNDFERLISKIWNEGYEKGFKDGNVKIEKIPSSYSHRSKQENNNYSEWNFKENNHKVNLESSCIDDIKEKN